MKRRLPGILALAWLVAILAGGRACAGTPAETVFRGEPGCALVFDLKSGRILDAWRMDRALRHEYPGNSVLKPVVAYVAVLKGCCIPDRNVTLDRRPYVRRYGASVLHYAPRAKSTVNLYSAMANSNNLYFYHLGECLGARAVAGAFRSIGARIPSRLQGADSLHFLGWGSTRTRVTAAEMGAMVAAFGNGGRCYALNSAPKKPVVRALFGNSAARESVARALRESVLSGTAKSLRGLPFAVSGKTGSVRNPETGAPLGVFAGFTRGLTGGDVGFVVVTEGAYSGKAVRLAGLVLKGWARKRSAHS
jgi:membrane peptidoglycan carboxypeptidase